MASTDQQSEQRRNAAAAHLALRIRQGDRNAMVGAEPTDEDLAAFYENRLDSTRRAQVLSYIANSAAVYERWMRCVDAMGYLEDQQLTEAAGETAPKSSLATQRQPPPQKSSPGWLGRLFGSPAGIVGGGLATAAIIVLAIMLVPTMHNEFDLKQGVDGVYQDWGSDVSREWAALPPSAKPKPKLDQRGGFFAQPKPKSDVQKVLETGLKSGASRVGKKTLADLHVKVDELSSVSQGDVAALTERQYEALYQTGRLVAVTAPQCYMDNTNKRLTELAPVVDAITAQLATLATDDSRALLKGVKQASSTPAEICTLSKNVLALLAN